MPCPFFFPTQKFEAIAVPHRARLPLRDGWSGQCTAPGHEGYLPGPQELADGCNLGYAKDCPRFPQQRAYDAIRFGIARDDKEAVLLTYVCEAAHLPVEHGTLKYVAGRWLSPHADSRLQRMAECYLQTYLSQRNESQPEQSS